MTEILYISIATLLGVIAGFLLPYVRKVWDGKLSWNELDKKYVLNSVLGLILVWGMNVAVFGEYQNPSDMPTGLKDIFVLLYAFFSGVGSPEIQRLIIKLGVSYQNKPKVS